MLQWRFIVILQCAGLNGSHYILAGFPAWGAGTEIESLSIHGLWDSGIPGFRDPPGFWNGKSNLNHQAGFRCIQAGSCLNTATLA